jgi:hypothetical protein
MRIVRGHRERPRDGGTMAPGEDDMLHLLRALTPSQRSAVLACYLGWTLSISSFLAFVMDDIAEEFGIRRAPAHRQSDEGTRQIWVRELAELSEWPRNRCLGILGIRSDGTG